MMPHSSDGVKPDCAIRLIAANPQERRKFSGNDVDDQLLLVLTAKAICHPAMLNQNAHAMTGALLDPAAQKTNEQI